MSNNDVILPDAVISAEYIPALDKLIVDGDSVETYCMSAFHNWFDAPHDFNLFVFATACKIIDGLALGDGKCAEKSDVTYGNFRIKRFTVQTLT